MLAALISRQPIFNSDLKLVGYELLSRGLGDGGPDGELSAIFLARALGDVGWEPVVGSHAAWVDCSQELSGDAERLFSLPKPAVLRVPAGTSVGNGTPGTLARLRAQGFRVSLETAAIDAGMEERLLDQADFVEIDVDGEPADALRPSVERLKPHGVALVAKKVDTREGQAAATEAGFDFLSGHFFVEPERREASSEIAPSRVAVLQLLSALQEPDIGFDQIQTLISRDVSLTYRLLRYINSPFFGLRREVGSIGQAVVLLGLNNVKRWLTMIVLTGVETRPAEVITVGLVRARYCELAGPEAGLRDTDGLFTMGLLSVVDALMDAPMEEALAGLSLPEQLRDALIARKGAHGALLQSAIACERGRPESVVPLKLPRAAAAQMYLDAQAWATETATNLAGTG